MQHVCCAARSRSCHLVTPVAATCLLACIWSHAKMSFPTAWVTLVPCLRPAPCEFVCGVAFDSALDVLMMLHPQRQKKQKQKAKRQQTGSAAGEAGDEAVGADAGGPSTAATAAGIPAELAEASQLEAQQEDEWAQWQAPSPVATTTPHTTSDLVLPKSAVGRVPGPEQEMVPSIAAPATSTPQAAVASAGGVAVAAGASAAVAATSSRSSQSGGSAQLSSSLQASAQPQSQRTTWASLVAVASADAASSSQPQGPVPSRAGAPSMATEPAPSPAHAAPVPSADPASDAAPARAAGHASGSAGGLQSLSVSKFVALLQSRCACVKDSSGVHCCREG